MHRRQSMIGFLGVFSLLVGSTGWAQAPSDVGQAVIVATNSAVLRQSTVVTSGDVVVNEASPGPTLGSGVELQIDKSVLTPAGYSVAADSISKSSTAIVQGGVFCNDLNGSACVPALSLPVLDLPPFNQASLRPAAADVVVAAGGFVDLAAGDYRDLVLGTGATLRFTGGIYNLRSIAAVDGAELLFSGPSDVRVAGRFSAGQNARINHDAAVAAAEVVFYVGGINGAGGDLFESPKAVQIGKTSTLAANFYAPNGTFVIDRDSQVTGAVLARDVLINKSTTLSLDSAFANKPPTAVPQTLFTQGGASIDITLTGSDPEGGDLSFAIVVFPGEGTLGAITPIVPDPFTDPITGETSQPPIVSATVTYTPTDMADKTDAFTFAVTDPEGASGMAVVQINPPPDVNPPPPPLDTVLANDGAAETVTTASIAIALIAAAPDGVSLDYAVLTLPTLGALTDSFGNDVVAGATLPSPDLTYTPAGTAGVDSFDFEACGLIAEVLTCDTATFVVTVSEPPPLAEDQTVTTNANQPVDITLSGNAGGTTGQTRIIHVSGAAAFLDGAEVAGNVSDANGDGLGDGRDNLPGPAPIFMAAAVDVNLGNNGSVTDPAGDATNSPSDDPANPDLVSAVVSSDGTNLTLEVRFVAAGFNSPKSRGSFVLDIDENPATGFPGVDAANNDSALMGIEFLVNIGANLGANAEVLKFVSLPNTFSNLGSFAATVLSDGYAVTIPLATLDGDDGEMTFKVETQSFLGPGFTGILDYMPDLGLAPGSTGSSSGIQGVARMQIEWDVSGFKSQASALVSASVILDTHRGTVDSLDTMFFVGSGEQDGVLTESDYEAPAVQLPGVVMPVPSAMPIGTGGTFSFDVTSQLRTVLTSDTVTVFSIQGRVDELLAGQGFERGLEVRTTATGNLPNMLEPKLSITTPGVTAPPVVFTVTSLPLFGTLKDFTGTPIVAVPALLVNPTLKYTPNQGTTGFDSFGFSAADGLNIGSGLITIVIFDSCSEVGRDPGCQPSQ